MSKIKSTKDGLEKKRNFFRGNNFSRLSFYRMVMTVLDAKLALVFLFASISHGVALGELPPPAIVPEDSVLVVPTSDAITIWKKSQVKDRDNSNLEFPDLIRFGDYWYCCFREGLAHGNHISGRVRLMRSADGIDWETVRLFESEAGDVRELRFSITPDGKLMLNGSIKYIADVVPLEVVDGTRVERRSVTWLSEDGVTWSDRYECPTGINTWRWKTTWHDGYGYNVGYSGKDRTGTLYRTADGITWEVVQNNFFPSGVYNEAALTFSADGVAYCLLRGGSSGLDQDATLGIGHPPYNTKWSWHSLDVVFPGSDVRRPFRTISSRAGWRNVGGPSLITLADGRLLGAARMDGVKIFTIEPDYATMTILVDVAGSSYPGLFEYDGALWFTYTKKGGGNGGPVFIARVSTPKTLSPEELEQLAADILSRDQNGFGKSYQAAVATLQGNPPGDGTESRQRELRAAIVSYQEALALRAAAESELEISSNLIDQTLDNFGKRAQEDVIASAEALRSALRDEAAEIAAVAEDIEQLDAAIGALQSDLTIKAAAEAALLESGAILSKSVDGFELIYQNTIRQHATTLQQLLASGTSSSADVEVALDRLRVMVGRYLEVPHFPATAVIDVSGMPAEITIDEQLPSGSGLLVNSRVDGSALTLGDMPVLVFSGAGVINLGNPAEIAAINRDFTISVWALAEDVDSYQTILAKRHGHRGWGNDGFALRIGPSLRETSSVSMRIFGLNEPENPYIHSYRTTPQEFIGRWNHYAYTFDGSEFILYMNGEPVVEESFETGGSQGVDLSSSGDLTVGAFTSNGRVPWKGYINDIRIRNCVLSQDQIRDEMNRLPIANEPDLIGYWPLNEGTGDRTFDQSGNGYHGEIQASQEWRNVVARRGYRLSGPFRFEDADSDSRYTVRWDVADSVDDDVPAVTVRVGFSDEATILPATWHAVDNGHGIKASDHTAPFVWVTQELMSDNSVIRPKLEDVVLSVAR